MCLSALLIFIYSLKISEWCSPDGWEVRRTCGGGHKVNFPKGKRRSPGDNSVAQLVRLVTADGTCEFYLMMNVLP